MNFFLDTNVLVGFIFSLDSLNAPSKKFIDFTNDYFISYNVKDEMKNVFKRKKKEYKNFLLGLCREISKIDGDSFISKSTLHIIISKFKSFGKLKIKDMHRALDKLWDEMGFGENQEVKELLFQLKKFTKAHKANYNNSFDKINQNIFLVPNHRKKDSKIKNLIFEYGLDEILHENDENILFDLNEYSKNHKNLKLTFVSWDDDFIKAISLLIDFLSFNYFVGRKDIS